MKRLQVQTHGAGALARATRQTPQRERVGEVVHRLRTQDPATSRPLFARAARLHSAKPEKLAFVFRLAVGVCVYYCRTYYKAVRELLAFIAEFGVYDAESENHTEFAKIEVT